MGRAPGRSGGPNRLLGGHLRTSVLSGIVSLTRPLRLVLPETSPVTEILAQARAGDRAAMERLVALVYAELHATAHRKLSFERTGHTLQTTALVNEAYLKLVDQPNVD